MVEILNKDWMRKLQTPLAKKFEQALLYFWNTAGIFKQRLNIFIEKLWTNLDSLLSSINHKDRVQSIRRKSNILIINYESTWRIFTKFQCNIFFLTE